mmetsp:Transcript_5383/g.7983  ORF Transcript_5383/g.7983 Transcript_5383/m.7983 type:complete len:98 (-) Transcript_5383:174-467(-)
MQPCSHKPPPHLASSPVLAPQVIGRSPPSPRFLCALVGVYTFTKFDLTSSFYFQSPTPTTVSFGATISLTSMCMYTRANTYNPSPKTPTHDVYVAVQ